MRLTGLHEVAVGRVLRVGENVVFDGIELRQVSKDECVAGACRAVVVKVGELDASINEEAQGIRGQIHRQNDEVNPVVTVKEVDARSTAV